MNKHQLRLLLCAGTALVLMTASMFATQWFTIKFEGLEALGVASVKLDLRSAILCKPDGTCVSAPLSQVMGLHPTLSVITFYGSCVLALLVLIQGGLRLVQGHAGGTLTRAGYFVGVMCFCCAAATGYLFQPETVEGNVQSIGMVSVIVTRTWAPAMMLLGDLLALVALYFATAEEPFDTVSPTAKDNKRLPVTPLSSPVYQPIRPSALPLKSIPIDGAKPTAAPAPVAPAPALAISRTTSSISLGAIDDNPHVAMTLDDPSAGPSTSQAVQTIPLDDRLSANERLAPPAIARTTSQMDTKPDAMPAIALDHGDLELPPARNAADVATPAEGTDPEPSRTRALRAQLSFATTKIALSGDGIAATCEDGTPKTVPWVDVVGVVARRLPADAPYDGETFIDLVSTAGATLRILPWTEIAGDELHANDSSAVERARAFVQLVATRCPEAKLDGATRTFLGGRGPAAQLPNAEILAQHDERLS